MALDRADWHYDDAEKLYRETHEIDGELSNEQINEIWLKAANHIGLFLRWVIENNLEGEDADEEGCKEVREGKITGAEYLMEYCDGKFWDSDIREDALEFVKDYYERTYYSYYSACCLTKNSVSIPAYSFISGDEDYKKVEPFISKAYKAYKDI